VEARRLERGEGLVLVGVSQIEEHGGFLYFASLAGFFVADRQLTSARLISADGPDNNSPFLIRDGNVYYQRNGLSGAPGIYVMDLDGGAKQRLHDGLATSFDVETGASVEPGMPGYLYFTSQADLTLCRVNLANGELDRFTNLMSDAVAVADPGLLVRNLRGGCSIDTIASGDASAQLLAPGGAEGIVAVGGFVYYNAWRDGLALYCAPLPDAFVQERVQFD
jgi:hypothetical protein